MIIPLEWYSLRNNVFLPEVRVVSVQKKFDMPSVHICFNSEKNWVGVGAGVLGAVSDLSMGRGDVFGGCIKFETASV